MRFVSNEKRVEIEVGDVIERRVLGRKQRYLIVTDGNKFRMVNLECADISMMTKWSSLGEVAKFFEGFHEECRIIKSENLELREV